MLLKTQKKVAAAAAGVLAGGLVLTGLYNWISSEDDAPKAPENKPAVVARAPEPHKVEPPVAVKPAPAPQAQADAPVPVKKKDDAEEKKAKLGALQRGDVDRLRAEGYTVHRRTLPFGRACNSDGTTDGTGYHGTSTSISYDVTLNGRDGKICVAHSGKGGVKVSTSPFAPK